MGWSSIRHQASFLAPLPGNEEEEEEAPTSTKRQQNINPLVHSGVASLRQRGHDPPTQIMVNI
jgi:hypothetical protein